jgi:hypothetical protein
MKRREKHFKEKNCRQEKRFNNEELTGFELNYNGE